MKIVLNDDWWLFGSAEGFVLCVGTHDLEVKTPRTRPLFSERNGFRVPAFKLWGYRLFWTVRKTDAGETDVWSH